MLNLPKKYLSYSQMRLWLDNKDQYRSSYYENIQGHRSPELLFGSEVAKRLQEGTFRLANLTQYPIQEHRIYAEVDNVPFSAYIDQYEPNLVKFREIKTGRLKSDGRPRWTQRDVDRHLQLDVYSLLLQITEGRVDEECHLDWIVTKGKKMFMEFDGQILEQEGQEVELEGSVHTFRRVISQLERDRCRSLIRSIAEEISRDYTEYIRLRPSISPALSSSSSSNLSGL